MRLPTTPPETDWESVMALKTKSGTVAGPVTLICATVCFLGVLGLFVVLFILVPDRADIYVRTLIPTLAAIGSASVLWIKAHAVQRSATQENEQIFANVVDAAEKAENATKVVDKRLNGELDARIQKAVLTALQTTETKKGN